MATPIQKGWLSPILLAGALLLTQPAHATGIYKSVDADGHVTYSSRPPSEAIHVEKITITPDYAVTPGADTQANLDAIKQTADQLEQERKQREQERKAAQQQAEEEASQQTEAPPETVIHYYPVFPFRLYPRRPYPWRLHPPRSRPPHSRRPDPTTPPHKPEP